MSNLNISMVFASVFGAISFLIFYPSKSDLGKGFTIAVLYTVARYVFIWVGVAIFAIRIFKVISNSSYWYITVAVFNLFIGALALILYFSGNTDHSWLNLCLVNLLIGFILIADTFFYTLIFGDWRPSSHEFQVSKQYKLLRQEYRRHSPKLYIAP